METVTAVADGVVDVIAPNRFWMAWNLLLAFVPAVLALAVFRDRARRSVGWWGGAAIVLLFLPNAPYVITDLVHLRGDVIRADSDLAVVTGVLPVYAAFIAAGFVAYAVVLREVAGYLVATGLGRWRHHVELALHGLCAVGVVLGRVARLNSWEPVTSPHGTVERIVLTLTWRWAPVAVAGMFVTIWVGHALTRGVMRAAWATLAGTVPLVGSALDRRHRPGAV
ncbi:MAG: DUF1361 domain-containing protein [Acidimicrobiia bacterium]